jgi:hypothetical protein
MQDPPAHHPPNSLKRSLNDRLVRREALKRKHPKHHWYMQKHSHASDKHPFHAPGKHKTRHLAERSSDLEISRYTDWKNRGFSTFSQACAQRAVAAGFQTQTKSMCNAQSSSEKN